MQYYRVLNVVHQQAEQRPADRRSFRFWRKRPDSTDYSWYAAHLRLHNALR